MRVDKNGNLCNSKPCVSFFSLSSSFLLILKYKNKIIIKYNRNKTGISYKILLKSKKNETKMLNEIKIILIIFNSIKLYSSFEKYINVSTK